MNYFIELSINLHARYAKCVENGRRHFNPLLQKRKKKPALRWHLRHNERNKSGA